MWMTLTPPERLMISRGKWHALLSELRAKGDGRRESGAFLLAPVGSRRIDEVVFFDDVDPHCLVGSIRLSGDAFSRLADRCRAVDQQVVADVHTHPYDRVDLSSVDRSHPMVALPGHVALVVPRFAAGRIRRREIGFHQYLGEAGWASAFGKAARRRLRLARS